MTEQATDNSTIIVTIANNGIARLTLNKPEINIARTGLFYDWLKEKDKLGGQHKVPRLSNTRDYLDELLSSNGKVN